MHLELFLVRVLIPCAPLVGVLICFSCSSSSLPQGEVCWKCDPLQGSCCGAHYLVSPLREGAGVHSLWWGCKDSSALTVQSTESVSTVGGSPLSTWRIVDCYSVTILSQLLDRTLLQKDVVWSTGLLCTWGSRHSGVTCRVAGTVFLPSVGNLAFLFFKGGVGGSPAVRHSGECWASVHLGRPASW
jgi:hypothetical protein